MSTNKYITNFQQVGCSTINVDLVCKDWNDNFSISVWIDDNIEKYTFIINNKRNSKNNIKTLITKEQTLEVVNRLNLVYVKSTIFKRGATYLSKKYVESKIETFTKLKEEKEVELSTIKDMISSYTQSLYLP